jgi:hypothetical protein
MRKVLSRSIVFVLAVIFAIACRMETLPFIEANRNADLKDARLGESQYHLMLPADFVLKEARGKEGQLGYNISPSDTTSTVHGFVEIRAGNPIRGDVSASNETRKYARSNLLNKEVTWAIDQSPTGYYTAYTDQPGDVNARASSKNREEVDKMIAYIATLQIK